MHERHDKKHSLSMLKHTYNASMYYVLSNKLLVHFFIFLGDRRFRKNFYNSIPVVCAQIFIHLLKERCK